MMSSKLKVAGWLLSTLIVGVLLGALASGALAQHRARSIERVASPGGFVAHMRDVIRPRDSEQWDALRPELEATDRRNREIIREANELLRTEFEDLHERVAGLLDAEQMERLERFRQAPPPPLGGRPPPLEGPPPREGPPPGSGRPPGPTP